MTRPLQRLVQRQGGTVSRAQLRAHGVTEDVIDGWRAAGWLVPVHRAVYALGHRELAPRGHFWAAVLACGPGAVLSHRSAAALLGVRPAPPTPVDVVAPRRVRQDGILAHRHRLHFDDVTTRGGLPVTTVARTLVDLADVVAERELERAYDTARVRRLLRPRALCAALERSAGRRGAPRLRAIVAADRPPAVTRSSLEDAFLALVRAHGLPDPLVNRGLGRVEVDFRWPAQRVIVEVDGATTHGTRRGRRRDYRRDAGHLLNGWRTFRFAPEDVFADPAYVAGVVSSALAG